MLFDNVSTLTVLDGFGLSHVLKPLSHTNVTVGHPCSLKLFKLWRFHCGSLLIFQTRAQGGAAAGEAVTLSAGPAPQPTTALLWASTTAEDVVKALLLTTDKSSLEILMKSLK